MMRADPWRLYARLHDAEGTGCRSPYLLADLHAALAQAGMEVHLRTVSETEARIVVDGCEVVVRMRPATGSSGAWFTVTANSKAVCITPFAMHTMVTHARRKDGSSDISLHAILYHLWSVGQFPRDEAALLKSMHGMYGIEMTACPRSSVAFTDTASFVQAIRLLLAASSEA